MKFIQGIASLLIGILVSSVAHADQMSSSAVPLFVECDDLTSSEQEFASNLSNSLKMLFCKYFNSNQRQAAMQLDSNIYSPDDAVQEIARRNGIAPPPAAPTERGCPAK